MPPNMTRYLAHTEHGTEYYAGSSVWVPARLASPPSLYQPKAPRPLTYRAHRLGDDPDSVRLKPPATQQLVT